MTKTYQVLEAVGFPSLADVGKKYSTRHQSQLWGEGEEIKTTFRLLDRDKKSGLDLLNVKTEIAVRAYGFIKVFDDSSGEYRRQNFTEYLKPVEFDCFHSQKEKVAVFQAAKAVSKGVLRNLRADKSEVSLREIAVDFTKLPSSVTFRNVSPSIRSEGFTGQAIQDDARVQTLMEQARTGDIATSLTSITIPFEFDGAIHNIQITKDGAICLLHQYENRSTEIELVMSAKRSMLDKMRVP